MLRSKINNRRDTLGPRKKKPILHKSRYRSRLLEIWATIVLSLIAIASLYATEFLVVWVFLKSGRDIFENREGFAGAIGTILGSLVIFTLSILFVRMRLNQSSWSFLGLKRPGVKVVLFWLTIIAVIMGLSFTIRLLFKIPSNELDIHFYETSIWPVLMWIAIVIFAPFGEEALFRGFMYQGFLAARISWPFVVLITTLEWSLLHVPIGIYDLSIVFIGGLVLGFARQKTNSLWIPIMMHMFWNLIAMIEMTVIQ
jgi:membrane protease YdiL (CAAX protease family)